MKDSPKQQIEFFQNEVKDILGKPPQYLIRWGISLYLLLFSLVIFLSATINYPVYTTCKGEITPVNTGQNVILEGNSTVNKLFVADGDLIQKESKLLQTDEGLITSQIDGRVKLLKAIQHGSKIERTQPVIQIQPTTQDYDLRLSVPSHLINKIKINQRISFNIDAQIIDGEIVSIPTAPSEDNHFEVVAKSDSNRTFINGTENIMVSILIDNKKILHKILNL